MALQFYDTIQVVSGKEDPLEHPYVILIHIHHYECQQPNQTLKKLSYKLNEWMKFLFNFWKFISSEILPC